MKFTKLKLFTAPPVPGAFREELELAAAITRDAVHFRDESGRVTAIPCAFDVRAYLLGRRLLVEYDQSAGTIRPLPQVKVLADPACRIAEEAANDAKRASAATREIRRLLRAPLTPEVAKAAKAAEAKYAPLLRELDQKYDLE